MSTYTINPSRGWAAAISEVSGQMDIADEEAATRADVAALSDALFDFSDAAGRLADQVALTASVSTLSWAAVADLLHALDAVTVNTEERTPMARVFGELGRLRDRRGAAAAQDMTRP